MYLQWRLLISSRRFFPGDPICSLQSIFHQSFHFTWTARVPTNFYHQSTTRAKPTAPSHITHRAALTPISDPIQQPRVHIVAHAERPLVTRISLKLVHVVTGSWLWSIKRAQADCTFWIGIISLLSNMRTKGVRGMLGIRWLRERYIAWKVDGLRKRLVRWNDANNLTGLSRNLRWLDVVTFSDDLKNSFGPCRMLVVWVRCGGSVDLNHSKSIVSPPRAGDAFTLWTIARIDASALDRQYWKAWIVMGRFPQSGGGGTKIKSTIRRVVSLVKKKRNLAAMKPFGMDAHDIELFMPCEKVMQIWNAFLIVFGLIDR